MDIRTEHLADHTRLDLDGDLTIYAVAELRQHLLAALQAGGPLVLDLAGVGEIDTAGLQLLMAAHQTARASGQGLSVHNPSTAVQGLMALYGLSHWFDAAPAARALAAA